MVRILARVHCTEKQLNFISNFLDGKYVADSGDIIPPLFSHGELAVQADGSLVEGVPFWFDWLPPDIRDLIDVALESTWGDFERLLRTLRWKQRSSFRIPDRSFIAFPYWRTKSDSLYYALPRRSSNTRAHQDRDNGWFGWGEAEQKDFFDAWSRSDINEPLGHELQNEAELLVERAPRSALLMAISAIEAGVKDHISRVAPVTDWLMQKIPSPPVGNLLRVYIPTLHGDPERKRIWNSAAPLFRKIQDIVVPARNRLSHTGKCVNLNETRSYIKYTRDVLYLLDYLEGNDWALNLVSAETRSIMGLPQPPERFREIEITVMSGPDT